MAKAFEFPVDITPEYYAAIGEITARFSWLEHRLSVLIREGYRFDKAAARAVLSKMDANTLIQAVTTLAKFDNWIQDAAVRTELLEFVKDVDKQRAVRNQFIHGVYGPETTNANTLYRILMKSGDEILEPKGSPVTIPQLLEFARLLRDLQLRGNVLSNKIKILQRR